MSVDSSSIVPKRHTIELHTLAAVEETTVAESHVPQVLELCGLFLSGLVDEEIWMSNTFVSSSDQVGASSAREIWLKPCCTSMTSF